MKKNLFKIFLIVFLVLTVLSPMLALAQGPDPRCPDGTPMPPNGLCLPAGSGSQSVCGQQDGLGYFICKIHELLNSIVPVLIVLGVVYFIWGVVNYVIADGEEAKKKGKDKMIYGIIGLAVIFGLWGLVIIVVTTFNLKGVAPALDPLITSTSSATCSLAGDPKFQDLLCYITQIINDSVIPLIFALATVMFVWGVVQFVINSDEEAKKEKGKQFMLWGIIALAVMVSVWGLVKILGDTFNVNTTVLPKVKQQP